jgi:flagellar biosynthesis/type III secretory pathway protein FliH
MVHVMPAGTATAGTDWSPDELPHLPRLSGDLGHGADAADPRLPAIVEEAYARGHDDGRRAAESAGSARLTSAVRAVEGAGTRVEQEAARWIGNAEENIAALAIIVARKILDRELSTDRDHVVQTVRLALAEFAVAESVRVRLNPADLHVVTAQVAGSEPLGASGAVRWMADPAISAGGCLIEGHERIVDGRVDAALERLYRRLSHAGS